jgi:cell division protein ZapE
MRAHFDALRKEEPLLDNTFKLAARSIHCIARTTQVIWFEFSDICQAPRGQSDYIELAKTYQVVMISHLPRFSASSDDAARRFIGLVDEFYDNKIKLILSAEVAIEDLYAGTRLQFEFKRTISRLQEMQSQEYWADAGFSSMRE